MAAMIEEILRDLKNRNKFGLITRYDYTNALSAQELMQEVEAVGKFRSPEFVIDRDNRFVYENMAKWVLGDPTMECINPETRQIERASLTKGIYLAGNTGTGKTWAMEIISYLAEAHKIKFAVFGKDEDLTFHVGSATSYVDAFIDNEDPVYRRVICINDLGTEQREALYMGNKQDVIRNLLDDRADHQYQMTCITSNIPIWHGDLLERYGERVVSRLKQMCNYLELRGKDRRK